jgi:MFS family permease
MVAWRFLLCYAVFDALEIRLVTKFPKIKPSAVMLLGVAAINLFMLLIPLAQSGEHLIVIRLLTGLAIGFAASAPFPIAAELMPAQHRRTLWRNLRDDAGQFVHLGAVGRLYGCR